jgi:hypothetical protein
MAGETRDLAYPDGYTPGITTISNVLRLWKPEDRNEFWGDMIRHDLDVLDMVTSVVRLLNRSGIAAPVGSVAVTDLHDESFAFTTTAFSEEVIGILLEPLLKFWSGLIKVTGFVPAVRVTGSVSIGDYLYTSTTAGVAQASSTRRSGAFGRALTEPDTNDCVKAILLAGIADSPVQTIRVRVPAAGAGTGFEVSVLRAERALEITKVHAIMDASVTGDAFNFCELSFRNKAQTAEINDFVFTAGNDATIFVPIDFGIPNPLYADLSTNQVATLKKTDSGAGLALPNFVLQVEYRWT